MGIECLNLSGVTDQDGLILYGSLARLQCPVVPSKTRLYVAVKEFADMVNSYNPLTLSKGDYPG